MFDNTSTKEKRSNGIKEEQRLKRTGQLTVKVVWLKIHKKLRFSVTFEKRT